MKVYLAARYPRQPELRAAARDLQALGHEITSAWIWNPMESASEVSLPAGQRAYHACLDYSQLQAADVVISFTESEPYPDGAGRGGRHVEFGVALALRKRLVVVGPRENVFHCLAEVSVFPTWEACAVERFGVEPGAARVPRGETATAATLRQSREEEAIRTGPLGDALRAEGAMAERALIRRATLDLAEQWEGAEGDDVPTSKTDLGWKAEGLRDFAATLGPENPPVSTYSARIFEELREYLRRSKTFSVPPPLPPPVQAHLDKIRAEHGYPLATVAAPAGLVLTVSRGHAVRHAPITWKLVGPADAMKPYVTVGSTFQLEEAIAQLPVEFQEDLDEVWGEYSATVEQWRLVSAADRVGRTIVSASGTLRPPRTFTGGEQANAAGLVMRGFPHGEQVMRATWNREGGLVDAVVVRGEEAIEIVHVPGLETPYTSTTYRKVGEGWAAEGAPTPCSRSEAEALVAVAPFSAEWWTEPRSGGRSPFRFGNLAVTRAWDMTSPAPDLLTEECPECHSGPGFVHQMSCSRGGGKGLRFTSAMVGNIPVVSTGEGVPHHLYEGAALTASGCEDPACSGWGIYHADPPRSLGEIQACIECRRFTDKEAADIARAVGFIVGEEEDRFPVLAFPPDATEPG